MRSVWPDSGEVETEDLKVRSSTCVPSPKVRVFFGLVGTITTARFVPNYEVVWPSGKALGWAGLGSIPLRLFFLFKGKVQGF